MQHRRENGDGVPWAQNYTAELLYCPSFLNKRHFKMSFDEFL